MQIVKPNVYLIDRINGKEILKKLEACARVCYKSEELIKEGTAEKLLRGILKKGHESVIEHTSLTVKIVCDRSASHQLVRHRLAAYSQESQRYCDYGKKGLQVIIPPAICSAPHEKLCELLVKLEAEEKCGPAVCIKLGKDLDLSHSDALKFWFWFNPIRQAYLSYLELRKLKVSPEDARSVLPNATKTEVVTTYNLRTWRHVLDIRCDKHAQWQIRNIMMDILKLFYAKIPVIFDDLYEKYYKEM